MPRAAMRLTSPSTNQAAPAASSPSTRLPIPLWSVIQTAKIAQHPAKTGNKFRDPYCGLRLFLMTKNRTANGLNRPTAPVQEKLPNT